MEIEGFYGGDTVSRLDLFRSNRTNEVVFASMFGRTGRLSVKTKRWLFSFEAAYAHSSFDDSQERKPKFSDVD